MAQDSLENELKLNVQCRQLILKRSAKLIGEIDRRSRQKMAKNDLQKKSPTAKSIEKITAKNLLVKTGPKLHEKASKLAKMGFTNCIKIWPNTDENDQHENYLRISKMGWHNDRRLAKMGWKK
jgi:hypothetical protein